MLVGLGGLGAALPSCTRSPAQASPDPIVASAPPAPAPAPVGVGVAASDVIAPPAGVVAQFHLSPFYRQYVDAETLPIVGSARVSPFAIVEARFLVRHMVGARPEILRAMAKNNVRLAVMAATEMTTDIPEHSDLQPKTYWDRRARGLGATEARPAVSAAEENLLDLPGDPYKAENILIHEFAHAIHERGMVTVDPTFDSRLLAAYEHARVAGLWANTYAATNRMEYWAEATQSWFDCNRANDNQHGPIDTRDKLVPYDPQIAVLLREVFGDSPWRYKKPALRPPEERVHLVGFDVTKAGRFAWPASAPPLSSPGRALAWLPSNAVPRTSPASTTQTSIQFENHRNADVTIAWLGFDGQRKTYATVRAGGTVVQPTFAGHVWLASDASGTLGAVAAIDTPALVEIR